MSNPKNIGAAANRSSKSKVGVSRASARVDRFNAFMHDVRQYDKALEIANTPSPAVGNDALRSPISEIKLYGAERHGRVEVNVYGCLSHRSKADFEYCLSGFASQATGVSIDFRWCTLNLTREDVRHFKHIFDCPVTYICTLEQSGIVKGLVCAAREFGLRRMTSYSCDEALRWLDSAVITWLKLAPPASEEE